MPALDYRQITTVHCTYIRVVSALAIVNQAPFVVCFFYLSFLVVLLSTFHDISQLPEQPDLTRQAPETDTALVCVYGIARFSFPHISSLPYLSPVAHLEAVSVHVHNSLHIPPALTFTGPVVNPALPGHQPGVGASHQSPLPLSRMLKGCKNPLPACLGLDVLLLWPTITWAYSSFAVVVVPTSPYYPLSALSN